jgi:hypothetical protein
MHHSQPSGRTVVPRTGHSAGLDSVADADLGGTDRRTRFRARQTRALTELLGERRELRGVHAFADHVDDAVRWTV